MRIVHGRVSKTNLPDYADKRRRRKLKEKAGALHDTVHNRLVGFPNDEYEKNLRKNINTYYKNEINVDDAERKAVSSVLGYFQPIPEYEPRYYTKNGVKILANKPFLNSDGKPFKQQFITKNGKRFRIR